ncbi:hypothetical protein FA95DRAFT_656228 [Auriscalpium vulgare]|uniref:Uncharacterized protein n=1 Tax=Auriscalpium vulgare TaxID=40419 RepID=A0ACB8RCP1_9AGAM|nr:hypothetical protein FA95DRAFT_656228 [Auriscalpium vulgare]
MDLTGRRPIASVKTVGFSDRTKTQDRTAGARLAFPLAHESSYKHATHAPGSPRKHAEIGVSRFVSVALNTRFSAGLRPASAFCHSLQMGRIREKNVLQKPLVTYSPSEDLMARSTGATADLPRCLTRRARTLDSDSTRTPCSPPLHPPSCPSRAPDPAVEPYTNSNLAHTSTHLPIAASGALHAVAVPPSPFPAHMKASCLHAFLSTQSRFYCPSRPSIGQVRSQGDPAVPKALALFRREFRPGPPMGAPRARACGKWASHASLCG